MHLQEIAGTNVRLKNGTTYNLSSLEGKRVSVDLTGEKRIFKRLLSRHMEESFRNARDVGWIAANHPTPASFASPDAPHVKQTATPVSPSQRLPGNTVDSPKY